MEKRKPFGDITNLSLSGRTETPPPPPAPSGKKKQGCNLEFLDEKKDNFTLTKPRKPDQIEKDTDDVAVDSSSKVVLTVPLIRSNNQSLLQG